MKAFDAHGNLTFGRHKGTHHSKLPSSWIEWACVNVRGFQEELGRTKAQAMPLEKTKPTGRYYQLKPHKNRPI